MKLQLGVRQKGTGRRAASGRGAGFRSVLGIATTTDAASFIGGVSIVL